MHATCTSFHRDLTPLGDSKTSWIHIAPVGEFPGEVSIPAGYDVPGWGVAKEDMKVEGLTIITERSINKMLERFKGDMLIDQDHLSHDEESSTEAMGWGLNLRRSAQNDGLELEAEWTPPGHEKITTKIYRKISPEFHGSVRFEDGVFKFFPSALTGAGLTNRPNLKTLRPVSANRHTKDNTHMNNALALLCGLIGASETATEQEITEKAAAFQTDMEATKKRAAEADKLQAENEKLQANALNSDMEKYDDVIDDKEATKELLQTNRAATIKVLDAAKAKLAKSQADGGDGILKPVFQKNRATAPDGKQFQEGDDEPDETASAKYRQAEARAHALVKSDRIPFGLAFDKAKAELGI